jgi:hypothetical protein
LQEITIKIYYPFPLFSSQFPASQPVSLAGRQLPSVSQGEVERKKGDEINLSWVTIL